MSRPTPPINARAIDFGNNVIIFDSNDPTGLSQKISQLTSISNVQTQDAAQFAHDRYAIFFKPGSYNLTVKVGYYMTVHGLGSLPDGVTINGQVTSPGSSNPATIGLALNNFWRGAENLAINPSTTVPTPNRWAVSQATFMRRVHLIGNGTLWLWDLHPVEGPEWPAGQASGGFIADCSFDSLVTSASQQQFLTRNAYLGGGWEGGLWNMVYVGVQGPTAAWAPPPSTQDGAAATTIAQTPVVREKPYLTFGTEGSYAIQVPPLHKEATVGVNYSKDKGKGKTISIKECFIARPGTADATATELNKRLDEGYHLILTPGIYHLDKSLVVNHPDTVILGLGMATLIPDKGTPAMTIADVDGVSLSGLIFDAGTQRSPSLLVVGPNRGADHKNNPTALFDCSARVGGEGPASATNCFTINSNDVILDNVWLWRADHGPMGTQDPAIIGWDVNPADNGITVNGDGVIAYGLFVEHFKNYQTIWNGNNGLLYFYQSEIPYDVPNQNSWMPQSTQKGFASYRISDQVTSHTAKGLGVYCYFRLNPANPVQLDNAIEVPDVTSRPNIKMEDMCTVWLDGVDGSAINCVVNGKQANGWAVKNKGAPVTKAQKGPSRVLKLEVQAIPK